MTDQVVNQENVAQADATSQQIPPLTIEQLETVKKALKQRLQAAYDKFVGEINLLPCARPLAGIACQYFDTGFIWFEKAIDKMPSFPVTPVAAPQSPASSDGSEPADLNAVPPANNAAEEIPASAA